MGETTVQVEEAVLFWEDHQPVCGVEAKIVPDTLVDTVGLNDMQSGNLLVEAFFPVIEDKGRDFFFSCGDMEDIESCLKEIAQQLKVFDRNMHSRVDIFAVEG